MFFLYKNVPIIFTETRISSSMSKNVCLKKIKKKKEKMNISTIFLKIKGAP